MVGTLPGPPHRGPFCFGTAVPLVIAARLIGALVPALFFLLALAGCSSSSPRFSTTGTEHRVPEKEGAGGGEFRFAKKIKAEEDREDDRKVDICKTKERLRPRVQPTGRYTNITPAGLNRDRVLLDVVSFLGVPYAHGGMSKEGMDCSGFTTYVYQNAAHRSLPRTVDGQYESGEGVEKDSLQFGDLVFFNTTGESPSHVGIYIEDDLFAHAGVTSGVTLSSLESTYYARRYVGARRVVR